MTFNKAKKRCFSLLEVMLAVSILAIGAGALFFRISNLIAQKRFETDSGRLKSLLLSSRMLALNTHTDWQLLFHKTENGWAIQLICRQDPDLVYPATQIYQKELIFNNKPIKDFSIDFFSTGQIRPIGELAIKKNKDKNAFQVQFKIPELFNIEENGKIAPFHPKNPSK